MVSIIKELTISSYGSTKVGLRHRERGRIGPLTYGHRPHNILAMSSLVTSSIVSQFLRTMHHNLITMDAKVCTQFLPGSYP